MKRFLKIPALLLAAGSFLVSRFLLFQVSNPRQSAWAVPKMLAGSVAPHAGVAGVLAAVLAVAARAPMAFALGVSAAVTCWRQVWGVVTARGDFDGAFGPDWQEKIPADRSARMLKGRWTWVMPPSREPRWERDVPFYTPPGADKPLLCDIWQPPAGTEPSGLAFIYFHGSAWHYLDKDFQTRPMFRRLAEQGHVVMDVAYRLCPEVDLHGMMSDSRRAIAWMKENAGRYGVNRKKIVVAGGSAGAHLAMMAAYTPGHPDLTPTDLQGVDTSVAGVVSWYGPVDLAATYRHTLVTMGVEGATRKPSENPIVGFVDRMKIAMMKQAFAGSQDAIAYTLYDMFTHLLGDMPEAIPHTYALVSPMSHVGPGCPPTLLFQGDHDTLVPVTATREFHRRLLDAGVRAIYVEFPQTEHGFDLVFPPIAPGTQAALYDVERFLALLAVEEEAAGTDHDHTGGESAEVPYKLEPVGAD